MYTEVIEGKADQREERGERSEENESVPDDVTHTQQKKNKRIKSL